MHEPGDTIIDYATAVLSVIVNAHLKGRIETQLLLDPKDGHPVFYTMPNSLIGGLWLHLAQTIDSTRTRSFPVQSLSGPQWNRSRATEEQTKWPARASFMDALVEGGFVTLGGPVARAIGLDDADVAVGS